MEHLKVYFLLNIGIFHCHVSLPESNLFFGLLKIWPWGPGGSPGLHMHDATQDMGGVGDVNVPWSCTRGRCYGTDRVGRGGDVNSPWRCTHGGCYGTDTVWQAGYVNVPWSCRHGGCFQKASVANLKHVLEGKRLTITLSGPQIHCKNHRNVIFDERYSRFKHSFYIHEPLNCS